MHSVTADKESVVKRHVKGVEQKEEEEEEVGDTAVKPSNRRMCIPGDNRVMYDGGGGYSVQMRRRQTHCERREQHFHHSP